MSEPTTVMVPTSTKKSSLPLSLSSPPSIPHITANYVPLSQIIASLTIHAHAELQNILETLPSVKSDLAKKRRLLDYLVKSRREFVKLYVLSKWTSVSNDVSKCIDVVSFLTGQQNCFNNVVNVLFTIERNLGGAKMRNPDIETALEVLKFGKPLQKSYDNFIIPLKPLSTKTVLNTLNDLNVLLSIRLALSEKLDPEYRNYEIADGRVKFRVSESFIIDLGVADDTVDAQFFFIDFRFCFDGCNKINPPIIVNLRLEKEVNAMLADKSKSVSDVFHWLLKFTQNYKLSIVNDQLLTLSKGLWSGVLNHQFYSDKSLIIVNYWTTKAGPRSSIKIGLSKSHNIMIKWQREGKDVELKTTSSSSIISSFGNYHLNVENLINEIIHLHIKYIIDTVYNNLYEDIGGANNNSTNHNNNNNTIISASSKKIKILLFNSKYLRFSIDRFTGKCILQNPTQLVFSTEKTLNELVDLTSQAPDLLFKLRYVSLQEEITQRAKAAGWVVNSNISISSDDMKRFFYDSDPSTMAVFSLRLPQWSPSWFLLVSLGRKRQPKWFMSRLQSKDKLWSILYLEELNVHLEDSLPDYKLFDQLSKFITSRFMVNGICHELDNKKVAYSLLQGDDDDGNKKPTILVNLPTLMRSSTSWAHSSLIIILNEKGIIIQGRTKNSNFEGELSDASADNVDNANTTSTSKDVAIDSVTGLFILNIPLSSSNEEGQLTSIIISKLSKIERMVNYVDLIKTLSLKLIQASMTKITFEYGDNLVATVSLEETGPITFSLSSNSPHSRVLTHLQSLLSNSGLLPVVCLLRISLPIYQSLQELEKTSPTPIIIVARSVVDIRIIYPKKNTSLELQLLKRNRKDVVYIRELDDNPNPTPTPSPSLLKSSNIWKERFSHPSIIPLIDGAVCPVEQVNIVLVKVNQILTQ